MPSTDITEAQFRELFDAASNWGRWPGNGGRGALNHLTPARIAAAARLVETGVTVTLSQVLCTEARIDVPAPADHHTTLLTDVDIGSGSVRFAKDYVGVDYHNDGHTHIDAFSHVAFDGSFFDGQAGALHILKDGLVGRGVLLDVPTVRGVLWLEPGEHVRPADLAAAEREQGATVGPDDILRVRTGHTRQAELEPWDTGRAKAGLHPTTASFLADRQVGCARLGRQQRHGPQHDRWDRLSHARPRHQRHGHSPTRLPPVRGSRRGMRGAGALGIPVSSPRCESTVGPAPPSIRSPCSDPLMLFLRVYATSATLGEVAQGLEEHGSARHVILAEGVRPGHALLTAEVHPESADPVLEFLVSRGVAEEDIALARLDEIAPVGTTHPATSLIWADVLGQARRNARPVARYLAFTIAAGVIAAFGVIEVNSILIVGAMAVSPDMLPISAACVGLAGRRGPLVRRALVTLGVGLGMSCLAATLLTVFLDVTGLLPSNFELGEAALSGLTTVDASTIGVAFAAGVAGILALETRASSAVGVAISVTTIPAAAYLGVAAGVGEEGKAWGALAVLGLNVAVLLVAGTLTLLVQRRWGRASTNSKTSFRSTS